MRPPEVILGVCAWLSIKFNLNVWLIRGVFIAIALGGAGTPILFYLLLYFVMRNS
ncbi:MAG: PspC domain-containing protein [Bacteroidetes bacterium SW_11_45_7]|jgi:phage shock protein PspC (stress-responsive transcriptional regulator)|nr:MAG: PspC domain-containing protein [Bacteroidetes bacterium SW_11_45_7]